MTTLFINRTDSRCGHCNRGADPYEKSHETMLGYTVENGTPGCGAEFTAVGSDYGPYMKERVMEMRPDLPWTDDLR